MALQDPPNTSRESASVVSNGQPNKRCSMYSSTHGCHWCCCGWSQMGTPSAAARPYSSSNESSSSGRPSTFENSWIPITSSSSTQRSYSSRNSPSGYGRVPTGRNRSGYSSANAHSSSFANRVSSRASSRSIPRHAVDIASASTCRSTPNASMSSSRRSSVQRNDGVPPSAPTTPRSSSSRKNRFGR